VTGHACVATLEIKIEDGRRIDLFQLELIRPGISSGPGLDRRTRSLLWLDVKWGPVRHHVGGDGVRGRRIRLGIWLSGLWYFSEGLRLRGAKDRLERGDQPGPGRPFEGVFVGR
jgi:hypothetical protein